MGEELIGGFTSGGEKLPTATITFIAVGGADLQGKLRDRTFSFEREIQSRSLCRFEIEDRLGDILLSPGQRIRVAFRDSLVYSGTVDEVDVMVPGSDGPERHIRVACVDRNQVADRFFFSGTFETPGQTTGSIIRILIAQFLAGEGITADCVENGVSVSKANWNYIRLSSIFDELARETNYVWRIDANGVFHFNGLMAHDATVDITDASPAVIELVTLRSRENYRNRQYLIGGSDTQIAAQTETFRGDGDTRTFVLARRVSQMIDIQVDGQTQGFGTQDVDQNSQWYFRRGERNVTQDQDETVMDATNTLSVVYKGLIPIVIAKDLQEEQAATAAIEGGSGIYEAVESDERIDRVSLAETRIDGLLQQYGKFLDVVEYSTDRFDIEPGMMQHVELASYGIDADYLVERVETSDIGAFRPQKDTMHLRRRVRAVAGSQLAIWHEFYRRLFSIGRNFAIRPDELVQSLDRSRHELVVRENGTAAVGDALTSFLLDPYTIWMWGDAIVGRSLFGEPTYFVPPAAPVEPMVSGLIPSRRRKRRRLE